MSTVANRPTRVNWSVFEILKRSNVRSSGCWEWRKTVARGYAGMTKYKGKCEHAYRTSYMVITNTDIPPGMQIDHLCRNRACVNPFHLEVVTRDENIRRRVPHKTYKRKRLTHCKRGHEFTAENTIERQSADGRLMRRCLTCERAVNSSRYLQKDSAEWNAYNRSLYAKNAERYRQYAREGRKRYKERIKARKAERYAAMRAAGMSAAEAARKA